MNNEVTRRGERKEAPLSDFVFCMEVDLDKQEFGVGHSWLDLVSHCGIKLLYTVACDPLCSTLPSGDGVQGSCVPPIGKN